MVKVPKGFNLVKRDNNRLGFVSYVRYRHVRKPLPSKWCTHTNSKAEAEKFALDNREKIIKEYLNKKRGPAMKLFEEFYAEGSPYFSGEEKRGRSLSKQAREKYHHTITKKFIPFLKESGINTYEKITTGVLEDFQDYLLKSGIKPQTVNDGLKPVRRVCNFLVRKKMIRENPCAGLVNIPVKKKDIKQRGCLELGKPRGAFDKKWKSEENRLLNMLVYTTGMRNSEIGRIKMSDVTEIKGVRFIEIKESKTESGERLVPLHDYVYQALKTFAKANKKNDGEAVFRLEQRVKFKDAVDELGGRIGMSEADMEKENITFYSGRHYWKTLMNAYKLGDDVEEIFMGHRVSNTVAETYNHRDKRGKDMLVKKAKNVFAILDKNIFAAKKK
jgi:integrase